MSRSVPRTPGADGRLELIAVVLVPRVKITVPSLPSGFVAGPKLCADLDARAAAEVALVCAPAGYGKTLLLADWARTSTAVDTAWVGMDRDDNDPRRLWAAVVAAMAGCPSVPAVEPAARPVGVACRGPAGVPRRAGRSPAGAATAASG